MVFDIDTFSRTLDRRLKVTNKQINQISSAYNRIILNTVELWKLNQTSSAYGRIVIIFGIHFLFSQHRHTNVYRLNFSFRSAVEVADPDSLVLIYWTWLDTGESRGHVFFFKNQQISVIIWSERCVWWWWTTRSLLLLTWINMDLMDLSFTPRSITVSPTAPPKHVNV